MNLPATALLFLLLASLASCSKYYMPGNNAGYNGKEHKDSDTGVIHKKNSSKIHNQVFVTGTDSNFSTQDIRTLSPMSDNFLLGKIDSNASNTIGIFKRPVIANIKIKSGRHQVIARLVSKSLEKKNSGLVSENDEKPEGRFTPRKILITAGFVLMIVFGLGFIAFAFWPVFEIISSIALILSPVSFLVGLLLKGSNPKLFGVDILHITMWIILGFFTLMGFIFLWILIYLFINGMNIDIL